MEAWNAPSEPNQNQSHRLPIRIIQVSQGCCIVSRPSSSHKSIPRYDRFSINEKLIVPIPLPLAPSLRNAVMLPAGLLEHWQKEPVMFHMTLITTEGLGMAGI